MFLLPFVSLVFCCCCFPLQELTEFVNMSRTEAKKKFLDFIKKWPIYGATFFRALQISRISKNPPEV